MEGDITYIFLGFHCQGVYTAARLLAELELEKGKYVQMLPLSFRDRRSQPLWSYLKISSRPVKNHEIETPVDHLALMHESVMRQVPPEPLLKEDSVMYLNSSKNRHDLLKEYELEREPDFILDSDLIARRLGGDRYPNLPVLGCVLRRTAAAESEEERKILRDLVSVRFGAENCDEKMQLLDSANYTDLIDIWEKDEI